VASFARISRSVATEQAYRSCDLIEMASRPESVSWRVRE